MPSATTPRPASLLHQRFAPPVANESFELACSLMLADNDVYLSDLTSDTFVQVCDQLREPVKPGN